MSTQALQQLEAVKLQPLIRRISALPNSSLLKLADYVEELIEEQEETEDIAAIDALTPEDYKNAVPESVVIAEYEAKYGESLLD